MRLPAPRVRGQLKRRARYHSLSADTPFDWLRRPRFHKRQKARAAEIERQGSAIRQLKEKAATDEKARAALIAAEDRYNWDVRVFTERQQSLPLACEVPILIEQRLFEDSAARFRSRMQD